MLEPPRFIPQKKAEVSKRQYLSKAKSSNVREGKLSNPRAPPARAMHGENLRKFMETRACTPRAWYVAISSQPRIQ
jgi:hypothetical protein